MRLYVCPCCDRTIAHEPPCWKYRNRRKRIGYWWLYGFLALAVRWAVQLYSFWRLRREYEKWRKARD